MSELISGLDNEEDKFPGRASRTIDIDPDTGIGTVWCKLEDTTLQDLSSDDVFAITLQEDAGLKDLQVYEDDGIAGKIVVVDIRDRELSIRSGSKIANAFRKSKTNTANVISIYENADIIIPVMSERHKGEFFLNLILNPALELLNVITDQDKAQVIITDSNNVDDVLSEAKIRLAGKIAKNQNKD